MWIHLVKFHPKTSPAILCKHPCLHLKDLSECLTEYQRLVELDNWSLLKMKVMASLILCYGIQFRDWCSFQSQSWLLAFVNLPYVYCCIFFSLFLWRVKIQFLQLLTVHLLYQVCLFCIVVVGLPYALPSAWHSKVTIAGSNNPDNWEWKFFIRIAQYPFSWLWMILESIQLLAYKVLPFCWRAYGILHHYSMWNLQVTHQP